MNACNSITKQKAHALRCFGNDNIIRNKDKNILFILVTDLKMEYLFLFLGLGFD